MDGVAELRTKSGISRKDFAEQMGVEPSTVKRWEGGEMFPSRQNLRKIKAILGCSYDALIDGSANPTSPRDQEGN